MDYAETIQFLCQLTLFGMELGLENTLRLAAAVDNPHRRLRFIHVAGTNGKGSTCAMLESIYRAAGYRVGLFTSPHLISFTERIQVNRHPISQADVVRLTAQIRSFIDSSGAKATFFEAVTVMALIYFAEQQCDLVVWETGLGGRLDATNIVTPLASVITNVQLDHEQWLGQTVSAIAREKAGIIKPNVPILTATGDPHSLAVISDVAQQQHAPLTVVDNAAAEAMREFDVALAGAHQKINAALALAVTRALAPLLPVTLADVRASLQSVAWSGRLQTVARPGGQTVLLDCAHNPAGAQTLADALGSRLPPQRPALVLGVMADKDYAAICAILAPLASKIFLSPVASERGADPQLLAASCSRAPGAAPVSVCRNAADALAQTAGEPFVVVTGSIHFIGEVMEQLGLEPAAPAERALNEYLPRPETKIRAVTFDIGGTLIEPWPSVGQIYSQVAARHGLHVAAEDLDRQFAAAWRRKKNFGYRLSDWSDLVNDTFAGLTDTPPGAAFFSDLYATFATAAPWRIFPDVVSCLQLLRRRGLKLGVISNWDDRLRPLLRALELDQYFDSILVSAEVGRHKPDPKIFHLAAAQLGIPPSAILHIGDSANEDAAGARAAGLQSRLLQRTAGETLSPEFLAL
jgi:dihydrofolate synthase/folylpolyglutamate synthase